MIQESENNRCDICLIDPKKVVISSVVKGQLLYCTCPYCSKKVGADIFQGTITCPACSKTAKWTER